ncbi:MAG TPA: hypothetical protein VNO19_10450 [Gemmatimonadales bacterium]|nr:hypothetical protein [Gemmatimonadales bacterium]
MHLATVILLATATGLGGACFGGTGTPISPGDVAVRDLSGSYRYLAYDSAGTLLLEGQLVLAQVDGSTLTGTWVIHWAPGADTTRTVGPQLGSGSVHGAPAGDRWHLTLTPGWADNNVDLIAEAKEGDLEGAWAHSIITGPYTGGSFQAVRQSPLSGAAR